MPSSDPSSVPRAIAPDESIRSLRVGIRPVTFALTMSRLSSGSSRLRMISANPNTPMAMLVKPMPSASSAMSKVMAGAGLEVRAHHRHQEAHQHHRYRLEHG